MLHTLDPAPRGVLFDYGNTLIPYGRAEMDSMRAAFAPFFAAEIPGADPERIVRAIGDAWTRQYREREETDEETDPRNVVRMVFRSFGVTASEDDQVPRGYAAYRAAFSGTVRAADGAHDVLREIRARGLRTGLVSNYSSSRAIRDSLDRLGFTPLLDGIVVSADLGIVKPRPEVFHAGAAGIGLPPEAILFVGDNRKADIAGGAAAGMRTALVTEHLAGRYHFAGTEENVVDVEPDLVLNRLIDLVARD